MCLKELIQGKSKKLIFVAVKRRRQLGHSFWEAISFFRSNLAPKSSSSRKWSRVEM